MVAVSEKEKESCFVGKAQCGHYRYACVVSMAIPEDFEQMAQMVRDGFTIEVKPVQFVWDGGLNFCECKPANLPEGREKGI